jgi:hypothetical protein
MQSRCAHLEYDEKSDVVSGPDGSKVVLKLMTSFMESCDMQKATSYTVCLIRKILGRGECSDGLRYETCGFEELQQPELNMKVLDELEESWHLRLTNSSSFGVENPTSIDLSFSPPESSACKAGGVGLLICKDAKDQECFVQSIIEGGSASKTGQICVGDKLLKVDGCDVTSFSIEKVVQKISGMEGSSVKLDMQSCCSAQHPAQYSVELMRSSDGYSFCQGDLFEAVSRSLMETLTFKTDLSP